MSENRVVIYSNGIADFQRRYHVPATTEERISIPVRQDHLADVLASFNVFGNVRLQSPPTFRPENDLEGNLSIDPQNVIEDLAGNLSGAQVRIERAGGLLEGTLVGLHEEEEATNGEPINPKSLVVLTDEGLKRCLLRAIQSFQFLDEDVQREIEKALQRNYQRIKPNSTFVELGLSANEPSEAIVQYTIPAAAWKISYRLRMVEEHPTELQGFAIVDNNTDEDWKEFRVCVVTGEPITFSTDLAQSKSPARKHVDLVSGEALGAVEVEMARYHMDDFDFTSGDKSYSFTASEPMPEMNLKSAAPLARMRSAQAAEAEVQEVGDFSIFESESPVNIPAQRSTVIPVFNVEAGETKSVLHYKHENHSERPFRSIDFTNTADFSLARGVCTVFEEGAYAGNCIMPPLKSGESQLLPHALETGVKVHQQQKRRQEKIVAIRIADGFCYTSRQLTQETRYHIKNSRDREFKLVLDHVIILREPELVAELITAETREPLEFDSKLADGARYAITLAPRAELTLNVVEQRIDRSDVALIDVGPQRENLRMDWVEQNLVTKNGPLADDPGVRKCLEINAELDQKRQEIKQAIEETERVLERQSRLRENIKTGGQDELTSRWRNELDLAEKSVQRIEDEQLPELREQERALKAKLRDALKSLSAEWSTDEA